MLRFRTEVNRMANQPARAFPGAILALSAALAAFAAPAAMAQSGYGYGAGTGGGNEAGNGAANAGSGTQSDLNGMPPGVGYNNPGGEISRQALQQAALAPEYHFHMHGPTASDAVGTGGGPPIAEGGEQPGYVQAKFVTPYGNATVMHHYGPGYPPPLGTSGGPNDGNPSNIYANGTVAGNPGLVNWGATPAWTREELGNGVWFAGAGSQTSGSPVPYVGSFND
jgi:hypothetical protein